MKGNPKTGNVDLPHLIVAQTYKCNYNCLGCNVQNGQPSESLPKTEVRNLIDRWTNYISNNGEKGIFHFKGGEPKLFDGFFENLNYAADKGLYLFITTNASLFSERDYNELEKIFKKTKGQIIISLDGSTNEINNFSRQKNSYDKVIETIKEFRKKEIPFAINYKVHEENQEDVENGIYLAKELGAEQFNLLPHTKIKEAINKDNEIPNLEIVLPQLEKAGNNGAKDLLIWTLGDLIKKHASGEYKVEGCTAGFKGFAYIIPNGDVYSCPNTVIEEYKLGTIDDSFEKIFESEAARNLRKIHEGRLICKGELEIYKTQPQNMEKLVKSEKLIKQKTKRTDTTSNKWQPIAVCFNRNW